MSRNPRRILWILAGLVGIAGVCFFVITRADRELQVELQKCREVGLPTTWQEYVDGLPRVPAELNAAKFYDQMSVNLPPNKDVDYRSLSALIYEPTGAREKPVRSILTSNAKDLKHAEFAVSLPHCRFENKPGMFASFAEPKIKKLSSAISLFQARAVLRADHDPGGALQDIENSMRIADHLKQQPSWFHWYVESAEWTSVRILCHMAYAHPKEPRYRAALRRAVSRLRPKDPARSEKLSLLLYLDVAKLSETPSGRATMGLKSEDEAGLKERLLSYTQPRATGLAKMVRAARRRWIALNQLDRPQAERELESAMIEFKAGLRSFPHARLLVHEMEDADNAFEYDFSIENEAQMTIVRAFLRATEGGKLAATIQTSDLLSPFDGKPIEYDWDGETMEIKLRGDSMMWRATGLRLPPRRRP